MKKIISVLLIAMLLCSLSVSAFADNFVNSVVNAGDTQIAEIVDADGQNVAEAIEIVAVNEAEDKLEEEEQKTLDEAVETLKSAENLAEVNAELKEAAGDKSVVVSDIIYISPKAEVKFPLELKLENKNANDIIGILQYVDGEWVWVDFEVVDGKLVFTVDQLGVFAFIMAGEPATSAQTGESFPVVFAAAAAVLACAAAWFFAKSRKVTA